MSWHYLQGQEAESWEGPCLDGAPDALLSLMPTPGPSCSPDRPMDACPGSRSGMMSPPSTASPGEDTSTSSAAASRARIFPPLGKEPVSAVLGRAYGVKWRELSVRYDRDTSSWKTHRCLFQEDLQQSSVTLPRWGLMLDGVCWERTTLAHLTSGIGSGYWLTPCAMDATPIRGGNLYQTESGTVRHMRPDGKSSNRGLEAQVKMWRTPAAQDAGISLERLETRGRGAQVRWPTPVSTDGSHGGRVTPRKSREGGNLIEAVSNRMWPTPTASTGGPEPEGKTGRKLATVVSNRVTWPTPRSCSAMSAVITPEAVAKAGERFPNLETRIAQTEPNAAGGQLNPNWVCWLMNWPIGWTSMDPLPPGRFGAWLRASRTAWQG